MIPKRSRCLQLMEEYGMLEHIVSHSLEVTRVALYLSSELNKRGQRIDLDLVEAASLLHDIAKTPCLRTREDHTEAGYVLLKGIGYERVGEIVGQHVWLKNDGPPGAVSEEEVVNYADKRVRHDQIVSLGERFQDLRVRYGRDQAAIDYLDRMEHAITGVERKIFLILDIHPDTLIRFLEKGERDE